MKRYLLLLFFSLPCYADPFYDDNPLSTEATSTEAKNDNFLPKKTACQPTSPVEAIHLPIHFSDLTLVGLVEINQQVNALFLDPKQNLIALKKNDYILPAGIQLTDINLKHLYFINWLNTEECHKPDIIKLAL